jgi:UDP-hydrolysing UDP-N-acetyl-D-glucosamine 2-epimerase
MKGVVAVLTTGRQDLGLLRSTITALQASADLEAEVWAGGMHLNDRFGPPTSLLRSEGLVPAEELRFLSEPPTPASDAGGAVSLVGEALERRQPDALLVAGDRWETLSAGLAATIARTPIAHLHGGEETQGAFDNVLRHALTKLAHLHLVSHEVHAHRVLQMGEDPSSVVVVGAPGLDHMYRTDLPGRAELETLLGVALQPPVILVTVHPATLADSPLAEVRAVAHAMEEIAATWVVTSPNADPGGVEIAAFWDAWSAGRDDVVFVEALGDRWYWGLLRLTDLVLGNSSSGIIEAPMAGVPAVNVGDRQRGRLRHPAAVDVAADPVEVTAAVRRSLTGPAPAGSVYPAGPAAPRILAALQRWLPDLPPTKRFVDLAWPNP